MYDCHIERWWRLTVLLRRLFDTLHQALVIECFYFYLVTRYADPTALLIDHW